MLYSSGAETAKGVKGNRKSFYHYTNNKKLNKQNMDLLLSGEDDLVAVDRDTVKTVCTVFTTKVSYVSVLSDMVKGMGKQPPVDENGVKD